MMGWTSTYPTANWGGTPTVSFGEIVVTNGIVYQAYIDKKAADIQKIADDKAAAATAAAAAAAAAAAQQAVRASFRSPGCEAAQTAPSSMPASQHMGRSVP